MREGRNGYPYVVEGHTEAVALFSVPPTDAAVESAEWIEYRPTTQITGGSAIDFLVPGTGAHYYNLRKTRLKVTLQLIKGNGDPVTPADAVGLVNMPMASLFSNVELNMQQRPIDPMAGPGYSYKAMMDTLLYTGGGAKADNIRLGTVRERFCGRYGRVLISTNRILMPSSTADYSPDKPRPRTVHH